MSSDFGAAQRLRLALLCVAQFVLVLDVVVVNVALPSIRADLAIADPRLPIVGVAYTLTFGALLIVFGRAGDLYGRRRLFRVGLTLFGLASLVAGTASDQWMLFAGRAGQGVGAAMVSPAALSLVIASFPEGASRNRALGVWGAVGSAGAIAGQVIGGTLVDTVGWRWIFLINLPIVAVVVAMAARLLAESRDPNRTSGLDLRGAVLLVAGLGALIVGLVRMTERGVDAAAFAITAVAVLALVALRHVERRHAAPLLDPALLAAGQVRLGNSVLALNAGILTSALFFTTLYLQLVLGMTPLQVGLGFAPVTAIVLVVSPFAGTLVSRHGVRRLLAVGAVAGTLGLLWLARVPTDGTYLRDVMPGLALLAVMGGLGYAPSFVAATTGVGEEHQGVASGLLNTAQELGAALGLGAIAALAFSDPGGGATAYRAGFLAAAATSVVVLVLSLRADPDLGRAGPTVPDDPAPMLVTAGGSR